MMKHNLILYLLLFLGNPKVSEDETVVSFMFKNINDNKPEEVCSFNLVITNSGMYKGTLVIIISLSNLNHVKQICFLVSDCFQR